MGLKANFSSSDVRRMMQIRLQRIEEAIIQTLAFLGEKCVNQARDFGDYKDQTGNLRSSIGYVIVANGKVVKYNFERAGSGKIEVQYSDLKTRKLRTRKVEGGGDGVSAAREFAREVSLRFRKGYTLIVVAGMNYAAYVEANGLNVLSSAETLCKNQMPILMNKLKEKAVKTAA